MKFLLKKAPKKELKLLCLMNLIKLSKIKQDREGTFEYMHIVRIN